jgi:hypothetical protein
MPPDLRLNSMENPVWAGGWMVAVPHRATPPCEQGVKATRENEKGNSLDRDYESAAGAHQGNG